MDNFDVAVIGAGPGGYVAAIRAAQLSLKTVLIEKDSTLGGTCLNVGCIPSKALLEASEMFHLASHRLKDFGVLVEGEVRADVAAMVQRKDRIVKELTTGIGLLMKKNKVTVYQGHASLVAADRLRLSSVDGESEIVAKHIILATGSTPVELPFMKFDGRYIVNSTHALSFSSAPRHLIVIGAGAVGLEMASVWRRLGAQVTVIEMLPQIVPFADAQVAKTLQLALKKQGIDIRLSTQVTNAQIKEPDVALTLKNEQGETEEISGDRVLVAVGRRPFNEGLGLENVGVRLDEKGRVLVDKQLRTNVPNIFAIGDLVAGPMLAHKAEEEGVAAAEIIAGQPGQANHDLVPSVVYTQPELAQVGINEQEAKDRQIDVRVGKFLFRANGRAKAMGEEEGMVKIIADAKTDRLLGVHMIGPRVSELISEAVVAMEFKGSAEDLARTIHAHPTLSEVVKEAALAVDNRAIHS